MTDVVCTEIGIQEPPAIVPAKTFGPGALRGDASLTLNTRHALNLFKGRARTEEGAPMIPGVYHFANYLEKIGIHATAGDPYADWAIIRIETLLDECQEKLSAWRAEMTAKLQSAPGLEIEVAQSEEPHVVSLKMYSPYAYGAVRLIGQYDALIAVMLTGQYTGMFGSDFVDEKIKSGRADVRHIFHQARDFRFSGVTREDIEQKNARALEAIEARGAVPARILARSQQPRFRFKTKTH